MRQIFVYVPETHLEVVKAAMFDAGGGQIGDYSQCAWQVRGQGQFRPGQDAQPFLGEAGRVEKVDEFRVEMVCRDEVTAAVVAALRASHPYEEPAFGVIALEAF